MLHFIFDELPTDAQIREFVRWCLRDAGVDADDSVIDFIRNLLSVNINTAYQLGHNDAVRELKEETIEDDKPTPTAVTTKPKWSMPA